MSSECEKCGEQTLECECDINELTVMRPIPKETQAWITCKMLHSTIPKKVDGRIIWVCKEGCND